MRPSCEMTRVDALTMLLPRPVVVLRRRFLVGVVLVPRLAVLGRSAVFLKQLESRVVFGSFLELLNGRGPLCLAVFEALLESV